MRMMTGALLILASTILLAAYQIVEPRENWMEWYGFGLNIVGWILMLWGFWHDLEAERWRRRRHQRKGDT